MDLLDYYLHPISFREIRIPAFAFAKQVKKTVWDFVDCKAAIYSHIIHFVPSTAPVQSSVKRGPSSPMIPLGRKPHFSRTR